MIDKQKAVHVCNMYDLMSLEIHILLRNHHHSSCQTYPSSLEVSSSQCPPKEEGNTGETAAPSCTPEEGMRQWEQRMRWAEGGQRQSQ